jgi:hypothetical protein
MYNDQQYPMTIAPLPDTAMGVLEMFSPTKSGITTFASQVINEVENGNLDPLRVRLLCDTVEQIADKIKTATKSHQVNAATKYGERPFSFMGAEFHYTPTKTEYDYKACGDPEFDMLNAQKDMIEARIKQRQEWLKTMGNPETVVNKVTGEIVDIYPPIKKQTMGVKLTIK